MRAIVLFCIIGFVGLAWAGTCPTYQTDTKIASGIIRDVWGCGDKNAPGAQYMQSSYPACGSQLNAGEPTPSCQIAGSGYACAYDFERAIGDDLGIPQINIDPVYRVPVFNNSVSHPTVLNTTQFTKWFRDDPFNIPIPLNLTMSNAGTCSSTTYQYQNLNFYPINGKGFGNYYNSKNYGFTFNFRAKFTYQGTETFYFEGDDDVWIYINDKLALDLGGVHAVETAVLTLTWPTNGCPANLPPLPCSTNKTASTLCACQLGLVKNQVYSFDLFYTERHTTASDIKFATSLLLTCPWYDWCGVCQGDGQSCCGTKCNDNNACTTDKCDAITGACVNTNVTCTQPTDKCFSSACAATGSQAGQCVTSAVNCIGTDVCKDYYCSASTGCGATAKTCNDNNACTIDVCTPGVGCSNTPMNCDDNDPCTTDSCVNGQCNHVAMVCTGNACTSATCSGGRCVYTSTAATCITGNKCYNERCDNSTGCSKTAVNCNDNNACTIDGCSPTTGCTHDPLNCDDGNACTSDSCDTTVGCKRANLNCDDGNACTVDGCSPTTGCTHDPLNCDDGNACTVDSCSTTSGCVHTPLNCDDGNVCTTDTCLTASGCNHTAIVPCNKCIGVTCPTGTPCNSSVCNPADGICYWKVPDCNDNNACTTDSCRVTGASTYTCDNIAVPCTSADPCKIPSCNKANGQCTTTDYSCNDNNLCTTDICYNNGGSAACNFTAVLCPYSDLCNPQSCNGADGSCQVNPVNCDDNNPCTTDTCSNGVCSHTLITCQYTDLCQPETCDVETGNCVANAIVCDDNNACTVDSCSAGQCVFTPIDCPVPNACYVATCNPFSNGTYECTATAKPACDDSNVCTNDFCDTVTGNCVYAAISCDDNNACTIDSCDAITGCYHTSISCNDDNACTTDFCDPAYGCNNTAIAVPLGNKCLGIYCDPLLGLINITTPCPSACSGCDPEIGCTDCPEGSPITVAAAIGIGAGVIAAIVLGAVAGVGIMAYTGKKGIEYLVKSKANIADVKDNPLYEKGQAETENPLYNADH